MIGELWQKRLEKHGYTVESFLEEFSSDDYNTTKEVLLKDLEFYIDEYLGYNGVEEPETIADDENEDYTAGWELLEDV